jgi:hypothetical protein
MASDVASSLHFTDNPSVTTRAKRKESKVQLKRRIAKAAATRKERYGKSQAGDALAHIIALNSLKASALSNPVMAEQAIRAVLLDDAKALTMGDRNRSYGDPFINFMLTARMKQLFWDAMEASGKDVQQNSPYGHSMDMIFTNLARIATSPTTHLENDRYKDGVNYFAIAYEVGVRGDG